MNIPKINKDMSLTDIQNLINEFDIKINVDSGEMAWDRAFEMECYLQYPEKFNSFLEENCSAFEDTWLEHCKENHQGWFAIEVSLDESCAGCAFKASFTDALVCAWNTMVNFKQRLESEKENVKKE